MTSPSSRPCRFWRSPRSSRACPSRRRGPRRPSCPRQPDPSSGSRSPCRRSRDGGRSPAPPRTERSAGSRSWRTPGPAPSQAAPRRSGSARSSSGSAPSSAPAPDASPRMAVPACLREAPSGARPGRAAPRTRKAPEAQGCGPAPAAATGSRGAGTRRPRSARAASRLPGSRCARGPVPPRALPRSPRREGWRAPAAAAQGPAGFRHCATKRVASPLSPSCSPNRGWWMERGPQARWRHLLSDSAGTTRRATQGSDRARPGHRRAWGENRRPGLFADPRPAEIRHPAGVRKISHQPEHLLTKGAPTAHTPPFTCSHQRSGISHIRQPVNSSRRKAATADGISSPAWRRTSPTSAVSSSDTAQAWDTPPSRRSSARRRPHPDGIHLPTSWYDLVGHGSGDIQAHGDKYSIHAAR